MKAPHCSQETKYAEQLVALGVFHLNATLARSETCSFPGPGSLVLKEIDTADRWMDGSLGSGQNRRQGVWRLTWT